LPDVVMCANDQTALGVLRRFRRHGVRVPEDVAVTGFDGLEVGARTNPPLTTVRQPMLQIGRIAVRLLVERLATPDRPNMATTLPVDVVIRESCGCPPVTQPLLIKGMELSARSTTSRSTNR
jgi:LacI family transcriptional regulator